jgi:hypothetical protein
VLPFGAIAGTVPRNATTELDTGHRDKIQTERFEHDRHVGSDIRRAEDVTAEVQDNFR